MKAQILIFIGGSFLLTACASKPPLSPLNLSRTTSLGLTYESSFEAVLDIESYFTRTWDLPSPGFRYLDFDNFGIHPLYKLTVSPVGDYLTTVYDLDPPNLYDQISYVYEDRGVKTQGFIEDNLKRKEIRVDAAVCPEIPGLFEKVRQAFLDNLGKFNMNSSGGLYTDSPRVDRYYYSGAPSEVIELDMTEDKTALFKSTTDLRNYIEQCAEKTGYVKQF